VEPLSEHVFGGPVLRRKMEAFRAAAPDIGKKER
jgi:hypothetical protein